MEKRDFREEYKRAKRRKDSLKKFKKRLKKYTVDYHMNKFLFGKEKITWDDKNLQKKFTYLKHTSTQCSCYMCTAEKKYCRSKQKKIDSKFLEE